MSESEKLSAVETAKAVSDYLRGDIAQELVDNLDHFGKDSVQLLKNHGIYQQDNRDSREVGEDGKSARQHSFMVRTKIPGGALTSDQLLAELDLCDKFGNQTLRVTTRQGLQLHGIVKGDLKQTVARINEIKMSTLAACGDVERNVMAPPVPYKNDPVHTQMQQLAVDLAEHLCPRTTAYHEIWVEDENGETKSKLFGGEEIEPIYGKVYLPRKFKSAIGLPGDNSVDLYAQDLGLMAVCEDFEIVGYNLLVGGGFGVTPSAKKTFVAIAQPLAFVRADQAIDVATAIIKVQRDFGNRADRKVARLKYTIVDMGGIAAFKQKVEEYYGQPLDPPRPIVVSDFDDGMGWHEQGDGLWFYGLNIENGRIHDTPSMQLKTALREICRELQPGIRLTPHQSMLFTDIKPADKDRLIEILRRHHVPLSEEISEVRRWSMACPALPTCGLSITESERALPGMIDQMEVELKRLGLESERFTVRMTGCPNGCARPYNSDIGLVGKAKGKYTVFVGGRRLGDRLNFIFKDMVPAEEVVTTLVPLFEFFKEASEPEETFGDFCYRQGLDALLARAEQTTGA
ncbi:MAG: NADPH-dependent assimilatory sulfite reductase hemoprotein subunit [Planctomycetales bacterium]|nr:NADPH-dependent assimilatory sulfite reductase hemoprotein subunit [Planctomycetales bacterium]